MRVAVFSVKSYDRDFLEAANESHQHDLFYIEAPLNKQTCVLAKGALGVCAFVNDELDETVLQSLHHIGIQFIALRCAGYNNVDLQSAHKLGIKIARVPAYSPYAVAEHTVGLILSLNRQLHRAYARVRENNFSLGGLLGFDLHQKSVGVIGTGKIGAVVVRILNGFGCQILAHDPYPNPECANLARYVDLPDLLKTCDIVTLHCPLTPDTYHMINKDTLALMKPGGMLINTSRGGLIDAPALIDALKSGQLGYVGLDVYEEEADLFFEDLSGHVLQDDIFARLLTFPNVLITGHQAFFTKEALNNIAETTLENLSMFEKQGHAEHEISTEMIA